jgi:transcriptional regulator with XRE-family HTH domain
MGRLGQVFGRNVRQLRQDRGLSQEALADAVGLAVTYVGQIERGRRNPTLNVVERFAEVLKVDPLDLLKAPAIEDGAYG